MRDSFFTASLSVMNSIVIRHVEKFPEPDFSRLSRAVFADVQQPSYEFASTLAAEPPANTSGGVPHPSMYRLGAYSEEELVRWSFGWMERGNAFYMANSGVVASQPCPMRYEPERWPVFPSGNEPEAVI